MVLSTTLRHPGQRSRAAAARPGRAMAAFQALWHGLENIGRRHAEAELLRLSRACASSQPELSRQYREAAAHCAA